MIEQHLAKCVGQKLQPACGHGSFFFYETKGLMKINTIFIVK